MENKNRTPERAAIHSIDHFALNVPSIDEAERFFRAFGLDVRHAGAADCERELYAGDKHRWARVLPANGKSLAYLSLSCFIADLPALIVQVRAAGGDFEFDLPACDQEGFWFYDPDRNLIQIKAGPKTSPSSKSAVIFKQAPPGRRGAHPRSEVKNVRPRRLSHVLLFTPDVLRAVEFYEQALGLRLSDRSEDIIAFTHAPHGSDHHLIAFAKSHAKGWHHCSWDVASFDEVGLGARQMTAAGYTRGWGAGRHVLGSNYFHYVQDPWGSFSEYSADIDFVAAGSDWIAGNFPPDDSLFLWGPNVPDYFTTNTDLLEGT